MNFDILYSIAVDVIQKRSVQTQNVNDYVCVLMTQNNSIFTGISTSTIKDGKLVSVSAEDEAIRIMSNSNENRISAMVVVNVHNLNPCNPCDSCKLLMLEINPQNIDCLIMQEDKSFIPLRELVDEVEQSIWDDGWGENFGMDSQSMNDSSIFNPNSNVNRLQNISPKATSIDFNPIPQRHSRYINSSYNNGNSGYMETINNTSTLQTAVVGHSNSTFSRQSNMATQQNSRFKEMLKDIISDDNDTANSMATTPTTEPVFNSEDVQDTTNEKKYKVNISESLNVKAKGKTFKSNSKMLDETRKIPSKKELKLIAKEKKKQAKKNNKILESMEKHSRT